MVNHHAEVHASQFLLFQSCRSPDIQLLLQRQFPRDNLCRQSALCRQSLQCSAKCITCKTCSHSVFPLQLLQLDSSPCRDFTYPVIVSWGAPSRNDRRPRVSSPLKVYQRGCSTSHQLIMPYAHAQLCTRTCTYCRLRFNPSKASYIMNSVLCSGVCRNSAMGPRLTDPQTGKSSSWKDGEPRILAGVLLLTIERNKLGDQQSNPAFHTTSD